MKIEKTSMNKALVVTLSMAFAILMVMNGAAQDQQDPFKKGQQSEGRTGRISSNQAAKMQAEMQGMVRVANKLHNIMIPMLKCVDAKIEDVVSYLHQQSVAGDRDSAPGEKGVKFLLRLSQPGQPAAGVPPITLTLRDISLMDAIKYITEVAGLKYRIEENAVIIHSPDIFQGELETRIYKVQPSTIESFIGTEGDKLDIKKFFVDAGIPFPEGTSMTYRPEMNLLIVKNTIGNLENLENFLKPLNVRPIVVSIEARMIEMPRLAADELFKEQGGLAKTFVINEKTLGAISEMVIKNKAKIVSQSKIITKTGSNCENKSVREFTYPTEWYDRGNEGTNSLKALPDSRSSATNSAKAPSDILIPTAFETRDCGTILNITPTIGPDGELIDIVCLFQRVRLSACPNKVIVNSPAGKTEVEQPVFLSEDVTTVLTIPDGKTVLVSVCDAISDQEKPEKVNENVILIIMTACVLPVNAVGTP